MRRIARGDVAVLAGLVIAGVLVAVVWRLIDPAAAKLGDDDEAGAAVDGTLALLGILAGLLTGAIVIVKPGRRPVLRTVVAVAGSAVAGLIAWKLGDVFGKPHLRAHGAAFTWPVATSVAVFVGALLPWSAATLNGPAPDPVAGWNHRPVNGYGGHAPSVFGRPAGSGPANQSERAAGESSWRPPDS